MRLGTWLVIALVGGLVLYKCSACVVPHSCTAIGCVDSVFIDAAPSDQIWPVGAYRMELQFDEQVRVCSFSVPAELPAIGAVSSVACEPHDPQLNVNIQSAVKCTEKRHEDAVSQSCERLEGQHTLQISMAGTPGRMLLRLERDGALVSEHAKTLSYVVSQPNGPDCEPLCKQSSLELRLD